MGRLQAAIGELIGALAERGLCSIGEELGLLGPEEVLGCFAVGIIDAEHGPKVFKLLFFAFCQVVFMLEPAFVRRSGWDWRRPFQLSWLGN